MTEEHMTTTNPVDALREAIARIVFNAIPCRDGDTSEMRDDWTQAELAADAILALSPLPEALGLTEDELEAMCEAHDAYFVSMFSGVEAFPGKEPMRKNAMRAAFNTLPARIRPTPDGEAARAKLALEAIATCTHVTDDSGSPGPLYTAGMNAGLKLLSDRARAALAAMGGET